MSYTGLAHGKCPVHSSLRYYYLGGVRWPKDLRGGSWAAGSTGLSWEMGMG